MICAWCVDNAETFVLQRCVILPSVVSPHITCQNNNHINSDSVGYLGNHVCHPGLSDNFVKRDIFFQEFQRDIIGRFKYRTI
jgi:hypothetical protein